MLDIYFMYILEFIKKPFIWLKRFRKRRGYNVHSPFAFNFITTIIYQRGTYYRYRDINELPRFEMETRRILKLIFRLVNFMQPKTIYYRSNNSSLPKVMQWAKSDIEISSEIEKYHKLDFVYLSFDQNIDEIAHVIDNLWSKFHSDTMFVLSGIGYSKPLYKVWYELTQRKEAGISFDLYDVGILLFDKSKNKQDYIINY